MSFILVVKFVSIKNRLDVHEGGNSSHSASSCGKVKDAANVEERNIGFDVVKCTV